MHNMDYRSHRSSRAAKQQAMLSTSNVVIEWNTTPLHESSRVYPPRVRNEGMASKASFKEEPRAVHSIMLSSGGKQQQHKHSAAAISDGSDHIIFSESPAAPGVPLVYRTAQDKKYNPEKINLDRRKLSVCPIVEGEERLRMLNLQHNSITQVQNLNNLRRLVYLDLYDNLLSEISGLDVLVFLRVLMLGKNKIRRISGMQSLSKLDVLDLHGNKIRVIENLSHLRNLRVLNLAGNEIVHTAGLSGMTSLIELNLRRNRIAHIYEVDMLPQLQRLYVSFNSIKEFSDIACITENPSLTELALDGNPLADNSDYRMIIHKMKNLVVLDTRLLTEEDRREVAHVIREEVQELLKAEEKEHRLLIIDQIRKEWQSAQVVLGNQLKARSKMSPTSSANCIEEVDGVLHLYGLGSLDNLYSPPGTWKPTQIAFHYIEYDEISSLLGKLASRYSRLKVVTLDCCNLSHFDQLDKMTVLPSLNSLVVSLDGNPITSLSLWQHYAIVKLNLLSLNNIPVTSEQLATSRHLFGTVLTLNNDQQTTPIHSTRANKGRQAAVSDVCSRLLTYALNREEKQRSFERLWPHLLHSIVNNVVGELKTLEYNEYCKL